MTIKEIITAFENYMNASLGVKGEVTEKAKKALEELKRRDWTPIYNGDGTMPEVNDDGYSDKLLVSFANCTLPSIGEYRQGEDGSGSFYVEDLEEQFLDYGLIVNAWMSLPEPYRED